MGVTASASMSKGKADSNDVMQVNTHVTAGNQLSAKSGGDTNVKGAVVSGQQVKVDVGGDLNLESRQDTSTYHSESTSMGASVTVGGMRLCVRPR